MTNDERDLTPNDDLPSSDFDQTDDDLRLCAARTR